MQFLKNVMFFFIEPLFWGGLLMTFFSYQWRLRNERENFRIAIDRDFYEGRHFIKNGFTFLLIGAVFALILGISLPSQTLMLYQLFAVIALLFVNVGDLSLVALLLTGCVTLIFEQLKLAPSDFLAKHLLVSHTNDQFGGTILLLTGLLALFQGYLAHEDKTDWFSPQIFSGKRGRRIAGYTWREFTVFPLIMFIPGGAFGTNWQDWFDLSKYNTSLMIMPIFVGAFCRIYKQTPALALKLRRRQSLFLAGVSFILAGSAFVFPASSFYSLALLLLVVIFQAFGRLRADHEAKRWYVETSEGVRIVAVKPDTPAAKMKLEVGDIILECNGVRVTSGDELYEALQKNSAYCRLKVKNFDGELKLAESAIYADSPHEIGLVLFE